MYDIPACIRLIRPAPPPVEEEFPSDQPFDSDDFCFVCRDGGNIMFCDSQGCKKGTNKHHNENQTTHNTKQRKPWCLVLIISSIAFCICATLLADVTF